tara:strand:- start:182 stop:562 length:381 start_codon:yes stop_codon:yes gene_type:complete
MTTARETADALESRGTAATADTGLLTGNVPTADDLGVVGNENWNGGNITPTISLSPLRLPKLMQNISASNMSDGSSVAGSSLRPIFVDGANNLTFGVAPLTGSGTWINVSGFTVAPTNSAYFVRIV